MLQFVLAALLATSTLAAPSVSVQWPSIFEPCDNSGPDFGDCAKHNLQTAVLNFSAAGIFKPCATSRPDFGDCAKQNLQTAVLNFSAGVPELDIPPFDPIFVPVVLLDYKRENAEGKMIIRNTKVYGLKDGEILDFRANLSDPSNLLIEVDFRLPSVFVEGQYKAQGKIVYFPVGGKGVYNISLSEVTGTWEVQGELVTIAGDQYLQVRHVNILPEVGDMKIYASNFFTGNEELNNAALQIVNTYWHAFYKEMLPFAAKGWDEFLSGVLNKLFLQVPFNTIFPAN